MRKFLLIVSCLVALTCSSQSMQQLNAEFLNHDAEMQKLMDYLSDKQKVSLMIDSIKMKFDIDFSLNSAEPLEKSMRFRNAKDIGDCKLVTMLVLKEDAISFIVYSLTSNNKERYNTLVSIYKSLNQKYIDDAIFTYNAKRDMWLGNSKYTQIQQPEATENANTVMLTVAIAYFSRDKIEVLKAE